MTGMSEDDDLEAVYREVPEINCIGKCWDSCTSIDLTPMERARIAERGITIPPEIPAEEIRRMGEATGRVPACPALTALGTCRVYDVRPLICRAFGAYPGVRCAYGCEPKKARSDSDFVNLVRRVRAISRRWERRQRASP